MKKHISTFWAALALLCAILLCSAGLVFAAPYQPGDINGDGRITAADAQLLKSHIMEKPLLTQAEALQAADANGDGTVNAADYVRIKNYVSYSNTAYNVHFFTLDGTTLPMQKLVYGDPYSLPAASMTDCTFAGWYVKEAQTLIEELSGDYWQVNTLSNTLNLYPVFTADGDVPDGVTATAADDRITVTIGSIGEEDKLYYVYQLHGSEYRMYEQDAGQTAQKAATPELLGTYIGQSIGKLTLERYDENGYDGIYGKYYVAASDEPAIACAWVTQMTSAKAVRSYPGAAAFAPIDGKKGVNGLSADEVSAYGTSYETVELPVLGLIAPNEIVDAKTGEMTEKRGYDYYHDQSVPAGDDERAYSVEQRPYIEFSSNGTYYYFNREAVGRADKLLEENYLKNVYSIGLLKVDMLEKAEAFDKPEGQELLPYYMRYENVGSFLKNIQNIKETPEAAHQFLNTGNEAGANYFIALCEFAAWRYTGLGLCDIELGDELDLAGDKNVTGDYITHEVPVRAYTEEIYRAVRLGSLAFLNYGSDIELSLPFSHYFNKADPKGGRYAYAPREMLEYMLEKTNEQGNFNWGISLHLNGTSPESSNPVFSDIKSLLLTGSYHTTTCITFTNLEVLQMYLEREQALCNGELRHVYITNTAIDSVAGGEGADGAAQQAGNLAYDYSKISVLESVRCFVYGALRDEADGADGEATVKTGLRTDENKRRAADKVFSDLFKLDIKQFWLKYAQYLQALEMFGADTDFAGACARTADLLDCDFDFEKAWMDQFGYSIKGNAFTVCAADHTAPYTGEQIVPDNVTAYKGIVRYALFDDEFNEIESITDAGTYKYKAYVESTDYCDGIESDYYSLIVTKAENALIYPLINGKIYFAYTPDGITLPEEITLFGSPDYTIKNANGDTVTTLLSGSYTLEVEAVEETDNYCGLEKTTYTVEVTSPVTVSTYDELVAALEAYYDDPLCTTVINLGADIDCEGREWNIDTHGNAFAGVFNGNGYAVKNFVLSDETAARIGFFGSLGDMACITGLTLQGAAVKLLYPEDDLAYSGDTAVGILAGEVSGQDVKLCDIRIVDCSVLVTNNSAKLHHFDIGGVLGKDTAAHFDRNVLYLRKGLSVENCNITFNENADYAALGGITGCVVGTAYAPADLGSVVCYERCTVSGGTIEADDPAGKESMAMGAYIGCFDGYCDVTLKDGCSADVQLIRYDARLVRREENTYTDIDIFSACVGDTQPRYLNGGFNVYNKKAGSLLAWFGMQRYITGRYYQAVPEYKLLRGEEYCVCDFTITEDCSCRSVTKTLPVKSENVTLTLSELESGYTPSVSTPYISGVKTAVTFFKAENVCQTAIAADRLPMQGNERSYGYETAYAPTAHESCTDPGDYIGYCYVPGSGEEGWFRLLDGSREYIDADAAGYTVSTLTADDFGFFSQLTLYGFVTAETDEGGWYQVIKLTLSCPELTSSQKNTVFLGDYLFTGRQYTVDTKGCLANYTVDGTQLFDEASSGCTVSGGLAYQYALDHPDENVLNCAVSHATLAQAESGAVSSVRTQYEDYKKANPTKQVQTFFISVSFNDFLYLPSGDISYGGDVAYMLDFTKPVAAKYKDTVLGSLVSLLQSIRADHPDARIILVTAPERFDLLYGSKDAAKIEKLLADIETIASALQIPVIDLFAKSGLSCSQDGVNINAALLETKDGIYPTYQAYEQLLYPCVKAYADNGDGSVLLFTLS